MLSNNEKSIFIIAYFLGTSDRDIATGGDPGESKEAAYQAIAYMLDEFGFNHDQLLDAIKFIKELNIISQIVGKEI